MPLRSPKPSPRHGEPDSPVDDDPIIHKTNANKPAHPFVRLGKWVVNKVSQGRAKRKEKKAAKAAEKERLEEEIKEERKQLKAQGKFVDKPKKTGLLFNLKKAVGLAKEADQISDDESDDSGDQDRSRDWRDDDFSDRSMDEEDEESEEYVPTEDDEVDAFRVGEYFPGQVQEPIERLGPEDIKQLELTMRKMQPKYRKAENEILEEKLQRAVNERLSRLRKANKCNAIIAFGATRQVPINLGNVRIPTLISVTGHHGAGGNLGVNGVYERYPDNYCGRPVYQKYLERDEWVSEPQALEFRNGAQAWAVQDLDDEYGGRVFPTVYDQKVTREAMKQTMVSVKVLPVEKDPDKVGNFRFVDKADVWFIYFDDLQGAWCIGPRPGSGECFAKCYGVDEAIPDNLGPDRWEVFDVGHRKWHTHKNLRTLKGGHISSAVC